MTKLKEFKDYYSTLKSCCMGADGEKVREAAEECAYFVESENDGPYGGAIVRVKSTGTQECPEQEWYVFEEWQDYTGHGCQCSCKVDGPFASLEYAIRLGCSEDLRKVFGLP